MNYREATLGVWVVLVIVVVIFGSPAVAVAAVVIGILAPVAFWYRYTDLRPGTHHPSFRTWLTKRN